MYEADNTKTAGVVSKPRLETPGTYTARCARIQKTPNKEKTQGFIVWETVDGIYDILDFMPKNNSDDNRKFIVGHAVELAQAISGQSVSNVQTVDWANRVILKAVEDNVTVDIMLREGYDKEGNKRLNVKYLHHNPSQSAVNQPTTTQPEQTVQQRFDDIPF